MINFRTHIFLHYNTGSSAGRTVFLWWQMLCTAQCYVCMYRHRMTSALSAKAFSVSAPPVWNSLSYNCRSAELLSTFKHSLKTELFDVAYRKREHTQPSLCHYVPLIRSANIQVCFDWLIDSCSSSSSSSNSSSSSDGGGNCCSSSSSTLHTHENIPITQKKQNYS